MTFLRSRTFYFTLIKILSTILILGAIVWELLNLYFNLIELNNLHRFELIFWGERCAVFIHFIEGIIAGYWAFLSQKNPIKYGVYTFLVGTVGLLELKSKQLN
ncbi:conserved hypothetical protein [Rippkaea orientalis PCC 8801]|uniref:Uncharacterized protein n=1 Tax=Rippkaea orientalis (strain PCC 8801 / RF-1) TaxID=41431 RepID=B7K255_RIPO1|nr:hypothetical protein [Rippkaea orientalis]ACK65191.1 conserved hypothetical protein [Rippkaea orientalis PCC 8801]